MTDERSRLKKIASNAAEEDRLKNLSKAADVRRDIEETLGHDVVNQEKLTQIAEYVWATVPNDRRASFNAADWQKAIFDRCAVALKRAEEKLEENRTDDKLFIAKIKILRQTFAQQVHRAMQSVSDKYAQK
ncbi:MAG TPA: hypothetical protein VGG27_11715 [Magnetospirillaceae bacterium]|jgi:hypothetical protein